MPILSSPNIVQERVGCTPTGRAHRPRALPLTAGLSGNVGSATVALSVFVGQAPSSRNVGQNVAVQGKGREPRISGLESQAESAGTDLHPQTGHLLPRTNGSQMLKQKGAIGRRRSQCCGGNESIPASRHLQPPE